MSEQQHSARPAARGGAPLDARARVQGSLRFAIDRQVQGVVHLAVVRSDVPHGLLRSVDGTAALSSPGVLAVIDGEQARRLLGEAIFHGETRRDQPVIAVDKVRYVGEPTAIVVASTRRIARRAARLVTLDIDPLPAVLDHDLAASPGAPQIHADWPQNFCGQYKLVHGDAQKAMESAVFVHSATYRSPTQSHVALEPHVSTATWLDDGSLEVWSGTQAPYDVRRRLAAVFGLPEEQVRVRGDNLGGAFGSKLDLKLEGIAALAAKLVGRPARLEITRDEVFVTTARHAATVTLTAGCDEEGRLLAEFIEIVYDAGAYAASTPRAMRTGLIRSPGPYRTPNVYGAATGRYTNTVPTGPFRGAMTGQVCFAQESFLDELAGVVGISPLEIRLRNCLRDGDTYATGEAMTDMHVADLLRAANEGLGPAEDRRPPSPEVARGRGIALCLQSSRSPSRSEAVLELSADGTLTLFTSSAEMGQGAHAVLRAMAARVLEVPPERIDVRAVDTAVTPFDTVTSSSRTTQAMGLAVEDAARRLLAEVAAIAAPIAGVDTPSDALAAVRTELSLAEVIAAAGVAHVRAEGLFETDPKFGALDPETAQGFATVSWHQACVAAEVEVHLETGRVEVTKLHGASWVGRAIDELLIRKQLEGGMIFGLGQATMEELVFDGGEPVNTNLSDYQIPSILDVPRALGSTALCDVDPFAEPHGVGESTVPPTAPAIANAIADATGARVRQLPLSAELVLRSLSPTGR